jgi:hypothetical protein
MMAENSPVRLQVLLGIAIVVASAQVMVARPRPHYGQYVRIQQIAAEVSTPESKAKAVMDLMSIVKDERSDVHLRQFAVEKLGDLGATEASRMLKALAEGLTWADATRQLKWAAFLAHWRITVAEQTTRLQQEILLTEALHARLQGIIASNVQIWAANELANRGAKDALPEIIKSTKFRDSGPRGEEFILLCKTKIELLNAGSSRVEALVRALAIGDFTERQQLKRWAIDELATVGTEESLSALVGYAITLQGKYYDHTGKRITSEDERFRGYASGFYRRIIDILRNSGMSGAAITQTGLRPDKFFRVAP